MASIFKRLYGKRIPSQKMDAEAPETGENATTTPTENVAVPTTETTTETAPTTTETTTPATTEQTTETTEKATTEVKVEETAATTTNGDVPTNPTTTTNGAPRSFQFGAKAKIIRDMISQHKININFQADQTQLVFIVTLLTVAVLLSFAAIATNYWQCSGEDHYGLWNTCQKQTVLTPPEIETSNSTDNNSTTMSSAVVCVYHNAQNQLELIVADKSRIDQVDASKGLLICGTVMYVLSLIALVFAYRFIATKPSRSLDYMRNLLVGSIFIQILAYVVLLLGFFLYITTERLQTGVSILFAYFGAAFFGTNAINFFTIDYKTYKQRQQQVQIN